MQNTSAVYKSILSVQNHGFESKLEIVGVGTFYESDLYSIETYDSLFEGAQKVGTAVAGEINVRMNNITLDIPRMAILKPYVRATGMIQTGGTTQYAESEWLPQGVYFVDTREVIKSDSGVDVLAIHGYDAILKTEQNFFGSNHSWPYKDTSVVAEIAAAIGITVDARTNNYLTAGYMIDLPIGYTMREVLEQIAGMNCGSFVVSPDGKLLFVPLYGFDYEVTGDYLADESGNALVFGSEEWCILV